MCECNLNLEKEGTQAELTPFREGRIVVLRERMVKLTSWATPQHGNSKTKSKHVRENRQPRPPARPPAHRWQRRTP